MIIIIMCSKEKWSEIRGASNKELARTMCLHACNSFGLLSSLDGRPSLLRFLLRATRVITARPKIRALSSEHWLQWADCLRSSFICLFFHGTCREYAQERRISISCSLPLNVSDKFQLRVHGIQKRRLAA